MARELTTGTNGGRLTVVGTTTSIATNVTVNGTNALLYGDATFAATNMPLTTTYTAIAKDGYGRKNTNVASVALSTNVSFQYDPNGNLTNDGIRSFAYDDENELTQVWVSNQWLSQFTYDGKMRRRIRQEFSWQSGGGVPTNAVYYIYDGNLVIQERNTNDLLANVNYTRGKDLSGSMEGAGAIGGLLARTDNSAAAAAVYEEGPSYYHADGNGNVTMLINGSQGVVAKYVYDAFGNTLSLAGPLANANLYRFSSKEAHPNSGLAYYLYRYYDPNLQRWPNRDPLGELGFESGRHRMALSSRHLPLRSSELLESPNLYEFVGNDPVDEADIDGRQCFIPPIVILPTSPHPHPTTPCTGIGNTPPADRDDNWVTKCMLCCDYICSTPGVSNPQGCLNSCYNSCGDRELPPFLAPFQPPKTGPGKPMPK